MTATRRGCVHAYVHYFLRSQLRILLLFHHNIQYLTFTQEARTEKRSKKPGPGYGEAFPSQSMAAASCVAVLSANNVPLYIHSADPSRALADQGKFQYHFKLPLRSEAM